MFTFFFFHMCYCVWYLCHAEYLLFVGISERANVCGFVYQAKTVVDLGSLSWSTVSVNAWMRFFPGLYGLRKSCPIIQVICVL